MANSIQPRYTAVVQPDLFYRHSDTAPPMGLLLAAAMGLIAGIVGAFAYAYLEVWIPIVYLNILLTTGFGAGVGLSTAFGAKLGNVRSSKVVIIIACATTLIAYYLCWIVWAKAILDRDVPDHTVTLGLLLRSPGDLYYLISALNGVGTWAIGHGTSAQNVSGIFLTLVWIIEAGVIFTCSVLAAKFFANARIFCEGCSVWGEKEAELRLTAPGDSLAVRRSLEAHDFSYLLSLPKVAAGAYHKWATLHEKCSICGKLNAISIIERTVKVEKKKKKMVEKRLLHRLLVHPQEVEQLRNWNAPAAVEPSEPAPGSDWTTTA